MGVEIKSSYGEDEDDVVVAVSKILDNSVSPMWRGNLFVGSEARDSYGCVCFG